MNPHTMMKLPAFCYTDSCSICPQTCMAMVHTAVLGYKSANNGSSPTYRVLLHSVIHDTCSYCELPKMEDCDHALLANGVYSQCQSFSCGRLKNSLHREGSQAMPFAKIEKESGNTAYNVMSVRL